MWWMFITAALAICGCAYPLVSGGQIDRAQADAIERGIQRVRELDFTSAVPIVVRTPDQARRLIDAEISRDQTDEQLRIGGISGAMTGLYPSGIDLKADALKFLSSQIIGFYEPHQKEMVIVKGGFGEQILSGGHLTNRQEQMVLAHELTHALQDQHFGVDRMIKRVKDNDDRALALKAVLEGDATIAGAGYVAGRLDDANLALIVASLADLPEKTAAQSPGVPLGILAPVSFQYADGVRFVATAWRRGGWNAVDALYRDPPQSTQQIMQPELYFEHPSPPAQIKISGYDAMLPGWKKVDDDSYGELLLRVILRRNLPPHAPALETLPRWAGDRIITLQKGSALTLIWIVAFHDGAAAAQFASVYDSILERMPGERSPYRIEVKSSSALIVIGPGALDFDHLAPAIWKASTIEGIQTPRPAPTHATARARSAAAVQ
jgi:hypothetical protein